MRPSGFEYLMVGTVGEAVDATAREEGAIVLAGGQSLIPLLRFRLAQPTLVVDMGRIPGLDAINADSGVARVGALATVAKLGRSGLGGLASEAAAVIADPLVRNAGTVGGNLAHADPQNDLPAVLVAARGSVSVSGPSGTRMVAGDDLFVDVFTTSLAKGELITEVHLPLRSGGAYVKQKRAAADYGVVAVAVSIERGTGGEVASAGIAITGAATVAPRAFEAEQALVGTGGEQGDIDAAAAAAGDGVRVLADDRGSERYKRTLVTVLTRRALHRALGASA